jgi:hypothetical protein
MRSRRWRRIADAVKKGAKVVTGGKRAAQGGQLL